MDIHYIPMSNKPFL